VSIVPEIRGDPLGRETFAKFDFSEN